MGAEFYASSEFTPDTFTEIAALDPSNPFFTFEYAKSMRALGMQPWALSIREDGRALEGCPGFLSAGRLNRSLEIPSVPCLASETIFWAGLTDFCRRERVSRLSVGSFASPCAAIPKLPGETGRRVRVEYVLTLGDSGNWPNMSSNHRRNIQKAHKAGILVERSVAEEACLEHARLQDASMERRMSRGEQVLADAQVRTAAALLKYQSAELFRARAGDNLLSSILILRAQRGAYYHSAGTSREGMAMGASHYLIRQVAEILRAEAVEKFNLGGADAGNPGLERFKKGFGAQEIHLESADFSLASPFRRKATAALHALRGDPLGLLRDLAGSIDAYQVYSCNPKDIEQGVAPAGCEFRKITDKELLEAANDHPEMNRYKKMYEKSLINDAYGVYVDGALAHVSWLVSPDHDRLARERNVKLRTGEAEITHAVTLDQYRKRGLYSYAIRCLASVCRQCNIQRVFMITGTDNVASQRGIEKAGLRPAGRIWRFKYRHLGGKSFAIRGHRLINLLPFLRLPSFRKRS
jgi:hypothetical protein